MFRALTPLALFAALASCGAKTDATNGDERALAKLRLTSSAFQGGQPMPAQYSCDGADQSPPLQWADPPARTKSFALTIDDPDAPNGTFRHWAAYDIPASTRSLAAGQTIGSQAINDFGKPGYGGPCPPKAHGPHHYHFKLFALDVDRLDVGPNPKVIDVEKAAGRHAIAQGELIGTYERR